MSQPIRLKAMEIIEQEEREKGWSPHVLAVAALEKQYGCDIVSTSPAGDQDFVEVKGWGEPFRGPSGKFHYVQDVRESQMQAAVASDRFRVEIVANLTAHTQLGSPYERLTLTAEEVRRGQPLLWSVDLAGKEAEIRRVPPDPPTGAASFVFDAVDPVTVVVPAVPVFDRYQEFFEIAIPTLAAANLRLTPPVMVVARVTANSAAGRTRPAGPVDRAKAIMDALHDQRRKPPFYVEHATTAPLTDDNPHFVRGLAVEVRRGPVSQVEYRLGSELTVHGAVVLQIDVDCLAPNDVVATLSERDRIERDRDAFVAALVDAWPSGHHADLVHANALVIRHQPGRDEDNTWRTWIGALTGRPAWSRHHWGDAPPLHAWKPQAVASITDPTLPCATRYEVVAALA